MVGRVKAVAVVQGVSGTAVQDLFRRLVDRWPSLRIAGAIAESHGLPDRACSAGYLHRIGSTDRFAIFSDQGPGSTICHLEGSGAVIAAEAVQQDIAGGCDLVLLSKFGKLEAAGRGLRSAFKAAIENGIPLLTSVSPSAARTWEAFVPAGFATLSTDSEIDAWIAAARL
jgi:hypothetical protein